MSEQSYFIDDSEDQMGRCLVLGKQWSDDLIDVVRREGVSVLRLSESMGWTGTNIEFLKNLKDIGLKGIEIYAWNVKDISPLTLFPNIEYLGLQCKFTKASDFSSFSRLTICKLVWRPKAATLFECRNMERLNVSAFPFEDLNPIRNMRRITRLQIISRKLKSLSGIEHLSKLRALDLAYCTVLNSLNGIEKCDSLEFVEVQGCKKIDNISILALLRNIKSLTLADCGNIESLHPLAKLVDLRDINIIGDTNIVDGNMEILMHIPSLQFARIAYRKHYSHSGEQISHILARRKN